MDRPRQFETALDSALGGFAAVTDEAVLVQELRAGSEEAFAYLLAVYQNPLYNLICRIVENRSDAADTLQEVFVKVFRGIKQFREESSLKTWMYKIAIHEASNHRRGWLLRRRREPVSLDEPLPSLPGTVGAAQVASSATPEERLQDAERHWLVERALASLAQPYRTVVVLREIEGLPYDEISHILGISEGTVKSRLARGRELLKRKLERILDF